MVTATRQHIPVDLPAPLAAWAEARPPEARERAAEALALSRELGLPDEVALAALTLDEASGDAPLVAEARRLRDLAAQAEDERATLVLSSAEEPAALFVLLIHALLWLRHLKTAPEDERRAGAEAAFGLYAPLANRLGLGRIKWELEDLALRYAEPQAYADIARRLEERRADREAYIARVVAELTETLHEAGIPAQVSGRPKHIYSIWRKMQRKHKRFEELFDVRAVRVLVDTVDQCYAALSVVHARWPFIPGEYDDYIAAPKANRYQSLHTAVIGPEGKTLEVQIRTHEMHAHAELGVAAHWRYKEGARAAEGLEQRIQQLRARLRGEPEPEAPGPVHVLTPKGEVIALPAGATPLDFAYRIHTEVGHRTRGAKVDGRITPLNTPLKSGQRVELVLAREPAPSRDWLRPEGGYLTTARARAKVRQWFKQQLRAEHILAGREALARELAGEPPAPETLAEAARRYNFRDVDDLYAAVGRGELGVRQVANLLCRPPETADAIATRAPSALPEGGRGLVVLGVSDLLTRLAGCCRPLPGDPVRGYISQGRGVTVHRADCPNLARLDPERLVDVAWGEPDRSLPADVIVRAQDRAGLLRDVSSVLAALDINVLGANTHSDRRTQEAHLRLTLEVAGREQLDQALARLAQIPDVLEARRA